MVLEFPRATGLGPASPRLLRTVSRKMRAGRCGPVGLQAPGTRDAEPLLNSMAPGCCDSVMATLPRTLRRGTFHTLLFTSRDGKLTTAWRTLVLCQMTVLTFYK